MKSSYTRPRINWSTLKDQLDLEQVITGLLGPSVPRRGERSARSLWWLCPFHADNNPSFGMKAGEKFWKCLGCNESGDAANLVMRLKSMDFGQAVRFLAGEGDRGPARPARPILKMPAITIPRDSLEPDDAAELVEKSIEHLWSPAGRIELDRLAEERGLEPETLRLARVGLTPKSLDMGGHPKGLVLPWYVGDKLTAIKLRQPDGMAPRYRLVFVDPDPYVGIFPNTRAILPGKTLVICEGELDCLLLTQELADLDVGVITLGSASARLNPVITKALLPAARIIIASDNDEAGEKFAAAWPGPYRRIRPPSPGEGWKDKDWGDVHARGTNRIRYYWNQWLGKRTPWEVLEAQRWEVMPGFEEDLADYLAEARAAN